MEAAKKWMYTLFFTAFISVLLFLSTLLGFTASYCSFTAHRSYPSKVPLRAAIPPAFAYYIAGGRGDRDRILRLLMAVYHPSAFGNVDVMGKPDRVTYIGASHVAATLRAVAILLKVDGGWVMADVT